VCLSSVIDVRRLRAVLLLVQEIRQLQAAGSPSARRAPAYQEAKGVSAASAGKSLHMYSSFVTLRIFVVCDDGRTVRGNSKY